MTFDLNINVGNLIVIALALIGFIGSWHKFGSRLDMLDYRVKSIEDTVKTILVSLAEKQTTNEKQIALSDLRIVAAEGNIQVMAKELSDLRRGEGFIRGSRRTGIDGQYS